MRVNLPPCTDHQHFLLSFTALRIRVLESFLTLLSIPPISLLLPPLHHPPLLLSLSSPTLQQAQTKKTRKISLHLLLSVLFKPLPDPPQASTPFQGLLSPLKLLQATTTTTTTIMEVRMHKERRSRDQIRCMLFPFHLHRHRHRHHNRRFLRLHRLLFRPLHPPRMPE